MQTLDVFDVRLHDPTFLTYKQIRMACITLPISS